MPIVSAHFRSLCVRLSKAVDYDSLLQILAGKTTSVFTGKFSSFCSSILKEKRPLWRLNLQLVSQTRFAANVPHVNSSVRVFDSGVTKEYTDGNWCPGHSRQGARNKPTKIYLMTNQQQSEFDRLTQTIILCMPPKNLGHVAFQTM